MKQAFDFINNNAIVASLITLAITTLIQIIFRISDRKYSEKQENKKESKSQFMNKAELHIEDNDNIEKDVPDISLFITDFKASVEQDEVLFEYRDNVLDKKKYKHMKFYLKNIGNADINQLDICVTAQKNTMLCHIDSIETFVKHKFVNYSYCYDRKILKDDVILIDIAYLEESRICNIFSAELALLFRDSYGNLYEQPFFIQQRNLYEPYKIKYSDFKIYTQPDTAIECFKNPWMW